MPNKIYVANEQTLQTVKTDVNGLHTKMGQTSDASTSSTIFGKLNGIGAKVSELLAPITQKVNSIYTKIGEPGTTQTTSVMGKLNQVLRNQTASAGITAQTKKFTEWDFQLRGDISITGCGKVSLIGTRKSPDARIERLSIDGAEPRSMSIPYAGSVDIYFEKSISAKLEEVLFIVQT